MLNKVSRRDIIKRLGLTTFGLSFVSLNLTGCEKPAYKRPGDTYKLGTVSDFLYKSVFVREKKFLIHRFDDGWAALSTRCTYLGCDLSYQNNNLYCPCCSSVFNPFGKVLRGPARVSLPWAKMFYKEDIFYVDMGSIVPPNYRFTTEEIEKVIKEYDFKFRDVDEIDPNAAKIPEVLQPKGDLKIPIDEIDGVEKFETEKK